MIIVDIYYFLSIFLIAEQKLVDERTFWRNYFFHCNQLREIRRIELSGYDDELDAEIIQKPDASCLICSDNSQVFNSIQYEYVLVNEWPLM